MSIFTTMPVTSKNKASDHQRTAFESLYKQALELKQKKEYVKAIDTYTIIIEKRQGQEACVECAKLYEDVGDIYYDLKDFQHAFEFMHKALQIYADNKLYDLQLDQKKINLPLIKLRAHVSYAILLRKMKKYKLSEKYFKLGIKYSSENGGAYLMDISKSYGVLHFEMGSYEQAEKLLLSAEEKSKTEGNGRIV